MERNSRYPSVSQKIHGQSCLLLRHFQDSPACSYRVMCYLHGMNWRGKRALLPAAPCLGKKSSSGVTPMLITIGAPAEKMNSVLQLDLFLRASFLTFLAPIQRVQILLQSQNAIIKSGRLSHPYTGILNCFGRTIWYEGFFSLWRGNCARIITAYFHRMLDLRANPSASKDSATSILDVTKLAIAGGAASLVYHPFIYADTRLANDVISSSTGQRQFNGIIHVCGKTLMSDGIRGLYRGWGIHLVAVETHFILSNVVIPATKPSSISYKCNLLPEGRLNVFFDSFLATMAVYPMYTLSRRMMMTSGEGETAKYKNTLDAFSQILKREGVKSFYGGGWTVPLRSTVLTCLLAVLFCLGFGKPSRRVAAKRRETGNDGSNPASDAAKLTLSNASTRSPDSEKK